MFTFSENVRILGKIYPLTCFVIISGFLSFHYGEMKHVIAKNWKLRADFSNKGWQNLEAFFRNGLEESPCFNEFIKVK